MIRKLIAFSALILWGAAAYAGEPLSHEFTGKDAAVVIGQALMKEGAGDEVRVEINGVNAQDQLAAATVSPIMAETDGLTVDKIHNRFETTLLLTTGGQNLAPLKLSGRYDEMAHLPMLKKSLQSGDIISEDDIIWDDVPSAHLRKSTITDSKALIGKSPKHIVSAGRPIRQEEISGPNLVNKGSQVTLIFKTQSLEIKTLGEAMESGAQGTVVRVKNITSKSIIQGVVEAEGLVRVQSTDSVSAGLM